MLEFFIANNAGVLLLKMLKIELKCWSFLLLNPIHALFVVTFLCCQQAVLPSCQPAVQPSIPAKLSNQVARQLSNQVTSQLSNQAVSLLPNQAVQPSCPTKLSSVQPSCQPAV